MRIVSAFALYGMQFCLQNADNAAENDSVASRFLSYFPSSNHGPKKKKASYYTHVIGVDFYF
jgi:hypothetical protein